MTRIRLLKSSIIRVFFNVFAKIIIFSNITSNLMLTFEKTYNLAIVIATFDSSLIFLYICIIILKFNFTIFTNFDFEDFFFANFINFDFAISNILTTNNESRSLFCNSSISNKLNFDNFLIKYFSKNFVILFD